MTYWGVKSTTMTDLGNFNSDSFSHGQIVSKLWLCQQLEPYLQPHQRLAILGCWYNVLGFMLRVRGHQQHITGYDCDTGAVSWARRICDTWNFDGSIRHVAADVNTVDLSQYDVVVNTSSEHMSGGWFDRVDSGALVCIQSSDIVDSAPPWLVVNGSGNLTDFIAKYPVSQTLFSGQKSFDYGQLCYSRFMLIGIKS